jgi:A/G-specific adenine glycosylase
MDRTEISQFQEVVWNYYNATGRRLPWREDVTPYKILVSELMLQQTQVGRVIAKFEAFMQAFPTLESLAAAPLSSVLAVWSGLGYNRRAKFLHQAAQIIVTRHHLEIPRTLSELTALPGIGKNTAGAILAYAYNQPVIFIETNIRSVYFYHFFNDSDVVDDKQLTELVAQTLDREHPRQWYWALMDYGTYIKQTVGNNIRQSRHYTKQSAFVGSRRQVRGKVLRLLLAGPMSISGLTESINDTRLPEVLVALEQEGFISQVDQVFALTDQPKLP